MYVDKTFEIFDGFLWNRLKLQKHFDTKW